MNKPTLLLVIFLAYAALGLVACDQHGKHSTKISATSEFAFDFYKQLVRSTDDSKNIIFSPLSIFVAFAMLKAGAKGNTGHEMEKVMKWQQLIEKSGSSDGHSAVKTLLAEVFAPLEKNGTISIANKLWMQKYFCASSCDDFISKLQKTYGTTLAELNFVTAAEKCREEINKWVEGKTNNKIKELFPPRSISPLTRFVLANAIYFKGKWKTQFNETNTVLRDFETYSGNDGGGVKKVPTMYQDATVFAAGFIPASKYQLLELPYENEQLSMLIILPQTKRDFRSLEDSLSIDKLNKMFGELYRYPATDSEIYLPKFKFTTPINLKADLQKLGMRDVFDRSKADLSGITGYKGMYVSSALHKAFISVDEEGTEAAAATGIGISLVSLRYQFTVNRPFIFMIRHKPTGTVLFLGRVMDPSLEQ